jgi:phage repressor protein C with HTH and peptisase S24 domain
MDTSGISKRITDRMKELGLKGVDITRATGMSSGGVSHWCNGTSNPSGKYLISLCYVLQCNTNWLIHGKGDLSPHNKDAESNSVFIPLIRNEVEVPFIYEVFLSTENHKYIVEKHPERKHKFNKSVLKGVGVKPSDVVCIQVNSSNMAPLLPKNAIVGVNTAQVRILDGDMYAFDHSGMLRINLIYRMPRSGLRIRSFNRDEFPDEVYDLKEVNDLRIIGRIFWYSALI